MYCVHPRREAADDDDKLMSHCGELEFRSLPLEEEEEEEVKALRSFLSVDVNPREMLAVALRTASLSDGAF